MSDAKQSVNAGVEALLGFTFQRNSALFMILDNYHMWVGKNFFVCIEHYDDVIFASLNENCEVEKVNAYQVKKSTNSWGTNQELGEILAKMTLVGDKINSDRAIKITGFSQELTFLTNKKISLKCSKKNKGFSEVLKEGNLYVCFTDLHADIKENIINKIKDFDCSLNNVENLSFKYIDMPNTDKSQRQQLQGKLLDLFKGEIFDANAAIEAVLSLFREVEVVHNQNYLCEIMDESKRVYSEKIFYALNVVCKKAKAYNLWRENSKVIARKLEIPLSKTKDFKYKINNCFDYFKDLNNIEFIKILKFVEENFKSIEEVCFDESECVLVLYERIRIDLNLMLPNDIVLFSIVAALVQVGGVCGS